MSFQTITLENPEAAVVFAPPVEGEDHPRVFFDLTALVDQFLGVHLQHTILALMTAQADPEAGAIQKARTLGENDVIQTILDSIESLRLEYQFDHSEG